MGKQTVNVFTEDRGALGCVSATVLSDQIVAVLDHHLNNGYRHFTLVVLAANGELIQSPMEIPVEKPLSAKIASVGHGEAVLVVNAQMSDHGWDALPHFFKVRLFSKKRGASLTPLGTWARLAVNWLNSMSVSGPENKLRLGGILLKEDPTGFVYGGFGLVEVGSLQRAPKEPQSIDLLGARAGTIRHVRHGVRKELAICASNDSKQIDLFVIQKRAAHHVKTLATAVKSRGEVDSPRVARLSDGFAFFWRKWNGRSSDEFIDTAVWFATADLALRRISEPRRIDGVRHVPSGGLAVFPIKEGAVVSWQEGFIEPCAQHYLIIRKRADLLNLPTTVSTWQFQEVVATSAGLIALSTSCSMDSNRFRLHARKLKE